MKKLLLTGAAALLMGISANAQLAPETFNGAGLPAGWSMIKVDNGIPSGNWAAFVVSGLTANAWMKVAPYDNAPTDSVYLTVSDFSPVGTANRWLITPSFTVSPNMIVKWQDYTIDASLPDAMQVWVSPTAGATVADFTDKIYDHAASADAFVQRGGSLSAYNGQTIRVAFRDNSTSKSALLIDNVNTATLTNPVDAAVDAVGLKTIIDAAANVKVTVSNQGAANVTSLEVQYKIDAAAPVVQTFSSLSIPPLGNTDITFTTPVSGLAAGTHTCVVTINKTNAATDPVAANNSKTKVFAFVLPSTSVQRNGLIEEFSSATCGPCASFNATFDPLATSNQANVPSSNFNLIKYQMNWPSPGSDASYNSHGSTRRGYYGVSGIPEHFTNGATGTNGNQAEITASKTGNAYLTISGTYVVTATNATSGNLKATVTVTPKFTVTGAPFSLLMAASERTYQNPANTNGQLTYIQAERTMFPNGSGTPVAAWTAGTPQTFTFTKPYIVGGVTQSNDNFWGTPMNSDLVVFVQDNEDHSVLQSVSIPATAAVSVEEVNGLSNMVIFPNPAGDYAVLGFSTTEAANIDIAVTDVLGHTVYSYSQLFTAGTQRISMPTADFAAGIYNVKVSTPNGIANQRLTVVR